MSENWTSEITPALKMLKARGGALDLKAAELIEALWRVVSDNVTKAAKERHEDLKGLVEENKQLYADVAFLSNEESKALRERDTLRRRLADERHAYDSIRGLIRTALLADGRDDKDGNGLNLGLGDLVQILIAEWRGARHELESMQGRRKYQLADLLLDERSEVGGEREWLDEAAAIPAQVFEALALKQEIKATIRPVLKEAGLLANDDIGLGTSFDPTLRVKVKPQ